MRFANTIFRWATPFAQVIISCLCFVENTSAQTIVQVDNEIVFRFFREGAGHFYTTDCSEAEYAAGEYQFKYEGRAFIVRKQKSPGTIPLYRFFYNNLHFYTTSADAEGHPQFLAEGILGYIYEKPESGLTPLYRSFNPASGDHFYTTDKDEYDDVANAYSGDRFIVGYVPTQGIQTCTPTTARWKDYHVEDREGLFQKFGDGLKRGVGDIFTPSRKPGDNAPQRAAPTQGRVPVPIYYAVLRVDCYDLQTGADRADNTKRYPSSVSLADAEDQARRDNENLCQANGDASRVEKPGTRRFVN